MGYKSDVGKVVDRCLENVHLGEPFFVLRAQDRLMIPTIRHWLDTAHETLSPEHHAEVGALLDAADKWQREHPDRVKSPD